MPTYIGSFGLVALRVLFAALFFWVLQIFWKGKPIDKSDLPRFLLCSLFGVALNMLAFFKGLAMTTPINASLIMTTTPILVLMIGVLLKTEVINLKKGLGVLLGMIGACLLISNGQNISFSSQGFIGDLLILLNATSYGLYLVLVRPLMLKYHPLTVVKWVFSLGILPVLLFGISDLNQVEWSNIPLEIWVAIVFVLLFVTVMTYLFNAIALKEVSSSTVSVYIYLQPLFAAAIALFFGKDHLDLLKSISGVLIFIGVFLASTSGQRKVLVEEN